MLVAYVDHHDKAYAWAERRRIEAHPRTGAIQIVEVRERVEEIAPPETFDFVLPDAAPAGGAGPSRRCSHRSTTRPCCRSACPPTGSPTCARRPRTASSRSPSICLPRPRRHCSNLPPRAGCRCAPLRRSRPIPSRIPTRCAASARSPTRRSSSRRWPFRGRNGASSFTPRSATWSIAASPDRPGWPARPAPARRSSPSIAPCGWRARTRTRAFCSRASRSP